MTFIHAAGIFGDVSTLTAFLITLPIAIFCGGAVYFFLGWVEKKYPAPEHAELKAEIVSPAGRLLNKLDQEEKAAKQERIKKFNEQKPDSDSKPTVKQTSLKLEEELEGSITDRPQHRPTYTPRPPKKTKAQRKKANRKK